MARRTNTDSIRELEIAVANFNVRIDNSRVDIARLEGDIGAANADYRQVSETITEIRTRLAVVEQRFEDLKQTVEQREQKRWAVVLIVISALAGGVVSVLLQKLLP